MVLSIVATALFDDSIPTVDGSVNRVWKRLWVLAGNNVGKNILYLCER
jgi:hypothetical protein